ncbi:MAG TPA: hypothetical protein VD731_01685 [Nitrosopumilaceae archaeon]|nr:hypothetical protein [Nitrosopumilaceae archaeon]
MSQLLVRKAGTRLYQDFIFSAKKPCLPTIAVEASCYVCGKGLEDGYSLTAKNSSNRILLFCSKHF